MIDDRGEGSTDDAADRPPLFRSWAGVYALVLGTEGLLILLFHLFTRHFR